MSDLILDIIHRANSTLYNCDDLVVPLAYPTVLDMCATDTEVFFSFQNRGVWKYSAGVWTQIDNEAPTLMAAGASTLYAVLSDGIYKYEGAGFSRITSKIPTLMSAYGSKMHYYVGVSGDGIYEWDETTDTETKIIAYDSRWPCTLLATGTICFAQFQNDGLYKYQSPAWTALTTAVAEDMWAAGGVLFANLGINGVYRWENDAWALVTISSVQANGAFFDSMFAGTFGTNGIWRWDSGQIWTQITIYNADHLAGTGTLLYGSFGTTGIWVFSGTPHVWTAPPLGVPGEHVYKCTTPGTSASSQPTFNTGAESTTTDGTVVWTECNPSGITYTRPCTFAIQPKYGDYHRRKKYAQPVSYSEGGDVYIYDKGLVARNTRDLTLQEILPADLTYLLNFIEIVRGAEYAFNLYDENGTAHKVIILNPDDIRSAPVSANYEGGLTLELYLFD
jgi:hypothetical protein